MTGITLYNDEATRKCGECTLCCKLLPVPVMRKAGGVRCKHQRLSKGCSIYATRPLSCAAFSCKWLLEDDTADLSRPDRAHYVLDPMPDYVTVHEVNGLVRKVPVVQVWVDPNYPNAHHDPALRSFLERRSQDGFMALIRYNSYDGFVLVPPIMAGGQWVEHKTDHNDPHPHTADDIFKALGVTHAEN